MIDKSENPAEIYLVPVFDGDHDHVWCDTPAPGEGMREEDATRYVREDIYLALKTQVEVLKPLARRCLWGAFVWNDHNFDHLQNFCKGEAIRAGIENIEQANAFIDATPAQCLAARDAEIKAQAVEEYCASFESMCVNQLDDNDLSQEIIDGWKAGIMDCRIAGRKYANQIRQAAKAGE